MADEKQNSTLAIVAVGVGVVVVFAILLGLGLGIAVAVKVGHLEQSTPVEAKWVSLDREFEIGLQPGGSVTWRPREGIRPRPRPGAGDAPAGQVGAEEPK